MKRLFFLFWFLTVLTSISKGQSVDNIHIIKQFYQKIYNSTITSEEIVREFIYYDDSLGFKNAISSIDILRHPDGNDSEHFHIFKNNIKNNEFVVLAYSFFEDSEKSKFNSLSKKERENLYSILPKNTIKNYILFKDDKIRSFFGFNKTGGENYTFIMYE